jgi:hypothetical protein
MATETDMDMELTTFAKYFVRRNYPNSAIWNASDISRCNFQWRYILVAPLHNGKNDMKILKNSYRFWNSFPNDVLARIGNISILLNKGRYQRYVQLLEINLLKPESCLRWHGNLKGLSHEVIDKIS